MNRMTITSFVPFLCSACSTTCAVHVLLFVPLESKDFFRPIAEIVLAYLGKAYPDTGIGLKLPSPRMIANQGVELHPRFEGFV